MKSNVQATPYFQPYALKALTSQSPASPKNAEAPTKIGRLRVLPMINPYSVKKISINKIRLPDNIQPSGENWFNNYE